MGTPSSRPRGVVATGPDRSCRAKLRIGRERADRRFLVRKLLMKKFTTLDGIGAFPTYSGETEATWEDQGELTSTREIDTIDTILLGRGAYS